MLVKQDVKLVIFCKFLKLNLQIVDKISFVDTSYLNTYFDAGVESASAAFSIISLARRLSTSGDMYYHLGIENSPIPFPFGINIKGNLSHPEIRFGGDSFNIDKGEEITSSIMEEKRLNLMLVLKRLAREMIEKAAEADFEVYVERIDFHQIVVDRGVYVQIRQCDIFGSVYQHHS